MAQSKINAYVNPFPSLTWNFLDINRARMDAEVSFCNVPGTATIPDGVCTKDIPFGELDGTYKNIQTGMGTEFDSAFDSGMNAAGSLVKVFSVSGKVPSSVRLSFDLASLNNAACDVVIDAAEQSDCTFIFDCRNSADECETTGTFGLRVRVCAAQNSLINIVFVNMVSKKDTCFFSLGSVVADSSKVEFTELELGGKRVYSGNLQNLFGYQSSFEGRCGYITRPQSSLDMNYISRQTGRSTSSRMFADGVVTGDGRKVWRGTIDFVRGCIESRGDEQENVLLLSPEAVNKTLPVILCDEEAVEGRHGASIGKLAPEILFYMQSRGIDEKTARRLMVRAKISAVCRFICDSALVNDINNFVEGVFDE